ncbi:MAG: hypothetical protein ACFFDY_05320 [Candidatus Thorarchaeota archaeon]
MYCKNCGEKLEIKNQRFCPYCGNKVQITYEASQVDAIGHQNDSMPISPPVYQNIGQKSIMKETPGSYSKKCLGFGIVSLVILTITFNIGSTAVLDPIISYIFPLIRVFIGLTIAHVIGIIFGIVSRIYYRKAEEMEPLSSILKAGKIIGIIGIIFNAILMLIAILMAGITAF